MRKHPLRLGVLALIFAIVLLPSAALAGNEWRPYDRAAFEKARTAGKTVIVSVHADW